jgi:hypothetical protein
MAGIGDLDLGRGGCLPESDRRGAGRRIRHCQAFAALWLLGEGRREECAKESEDRKN